MLFLCQTSWLTRSDSMQLVAASVNNRRGAYFPRSRLKGVRAAACPVESRSSSRMAAIRSGGCVASGTQRRRAQWNLGVKLVGRGCFEPTLHCITILELTHSRIQQSVLRSLMSLHSPSCADTCFCPSPHYLLLYLL